MIKKLNEDTSLKFKNISPEEKTAKGILGRLTVQLQALQLLLEMVVTMAKICGKNYLIQI